MAESAFSGGVRNPALDHIVERIVNQTGSAEGTTLPPKQSGELRVPIVSGLRVTKVVPYLGGAEVTIAWREPENYPKQLSHFNIYTQGLFSDSKVQQGPATSRRSPATLRLSTNQNTVAVFTVQTVLKSGLMSLIQVSPSVSCPLQQAALTPSDFLPGTIPINALQNGTPGEIISWNAAGVVETFGPGIADSILVGTGAAIPTFKTRASLDLVEGRTALTTPDEIVIVDSAGKVTESGVDIADVVTGAGNLNIASNIPYVDNPLTGSLKSESSFQYDEGTQTLEVPNVATTNLFLNVFTDVFSSDIQVFSADVLNLFTVPQEVLPAPGAGKVLNIVKVLIWSIYGTIPYLNGGGGDAILSFDGGVTNALSSALTPVFLNGATTYAGVTPAPFSISSSGGLDENLPLVLCKQTADFLAGDSDIVVRVFYTIEDITIF